MSSLEAASKGSKRPGIRAWSAPRTARLMPFNFCAYIRLKSETPRPSVSSLHSTMSQVARTLCVDLTSEIEQCAICSNELGEGSGKAGLVYVLKNCRCVSCHSQHRMKFINWRKVICGLCVQFPSVAPFLPCQHANHLSLGWQRPLRLYNLRCAICLDSYSSTRVALVCGKFTPSTAVLADIQGHVYCRACILQWAGTNWSKFNTRADCVDCPTCRNDRTKLWRLVASDQVVMPAQRGVEIVSVGDSP